MINNEQQYKRNSSTRYEEDYVEYDPGMTASRNAYVDEYETAQKEDYRNPTADFEQMIDQQVETDNHKKNEDLFPTDTTLQFVGEDRNYIYEDLNEREKVVEDEDRSAYKINTKGKIMIAVYALVVLTIFTLIILNTRLIRNMNTSITQSEARIAVLQNENVALSDELDFVSSNEEIIRKATSDLNMVAGN